jgi:hypothetical protein
MKAVSRTILYKAILASLLLLLLQSNVIAQDENQYDTTAVVSVDTSYIDTEENDNAGVENVPDTPIFRKVPDSTLRRLQTSKEFEYANDSEYWVKKEVKKKEIDDEYWLDRLLRQKWLKYVVLMIMIATLMYALAKIAISNRLVLFRGRPTASAAFEDKELLESNNLPELITQAEQAGNFRLAVRYRYMKALQDLEGRKLIQLSAHSTNWDYVNKLGGHPLKKQFQFLTRAYEYVWYGEFEINGEQYGYVKTEFQQFENSL